MTSTTRTNNKSNSGTVLLTVQQKLDNLQQQIIDGTLYDKTIEKNKLVNQIVKQNKQKETNKLKKNTMTTKRSKLTSTPTIESNRSTISEYKQRNIIDSKEIKQKQRLKKPQ